MFAIGQPGRPWQVRAPLRAAIQPQDYVPLATTAQIKDYQSRLAAWEGKTAAIRGQIEALEKPERIKADAFLANTGILAGEIKHLNGLRVAYRHLLPWYIRATEWRLSLTHCLRLIPLEPLQSAAAGGVRSCPGLIIVVDARIVDTLGLRLGKSSGFSSEANGPRQNLMAR